MKGAPRDVLGPQGSPGQSRSRTVSLLLPVYVPTFFLAFSQGITIPTLPLYVQLFTSSFGLISIAISAAALGTLITDVPAGMMMERVGRKPLMIVGTTALAVSSLLLALAHVYPEIIVYRLVFGAGTAMWNLSRMAFITEVIPIADRGRALSAFGGITRIGVFAGPAVGGFVGQWYGLNVPFFVGAVLAAIALVISALFVPESRSPSAGARPHLRWRVVGDVARHHWRDLSTAGAAQIFAQMIRAGRQTIVPLYGSTVLGLDVAAIGTIVSLSSAIDMSLFVPAGFIMDRLGRKFASVPSFAILGIGMALIPFAHDYAGLFLATCVMALGNGLGSGAMMTLGADLAPREATGEFLGVWRLIGDIGGTGGPLVVGAAADALGLGFAAYMLAGVGFFAAATLVLFVRETLVQPG